LEVRHEKEPKVVPCSKDHIEVSAYCLVGKIEPFLSLLHLTTPKLNSGFSTQC